MIENLTSDQLAFIQHLGFAIAGGIFIISGLYVLIGLITPSRFGLEKRLSVLARGIAMVAFAFALAGGVVFFTHSHPNGPHSFKTYINDYIRKECRAGKDLPGCKDLKDLEDSAAP